jgi:glycosyltransferase involved in cell wall biosynthesis
MSAPAPVLCLNLYATMGGAERALVELLAGLDRGRFTPLAVLGSDGPLGAELRARGVDVVVEPFPTPPLWSLGWPPTFLAVRRAAARIGALAASRGVRVVQCGDVLGLLLLGPALRAGARLVYQVNYLGHGPRLALLRALAPRVSHVVACSAFQAAQVARDAPALRSRTTVVAPGVDAAGFSGGDGAAFRREIGVPAEAFLAGMLGRYDVWKGHDVLLDAAARLVPSHASLYFAMIGGALNAAELPHVARYRDAMLARRQALGLGDRVKVVDHRADVKDALAALDVVVMPSREEPFGMALVEAMAAGRPVVASDSGGPREIVEDATSGRLFRTGDPAALAAVLQELAADPAQAARLAEAGKARAESLYGRARYAAAMQEIYGRLA